MNQYYNPYMMPNVLPPQQILQANGKASIDALRMSPNSSALIADSTMPIVWRCVSDSLGNVTAEPFDIVPHKEEEKVTQETLISNMDERLRRLEEKYESFISRNSAEPYDAEYSASKEITAKRKKSAGIHEPIDDE